MAERMGFSPEDEATIGNLVTDAYRLKDQQNSPVIALAKAFLEEGYRRLRETSSYNQVESSVLTAPDPYNFFEDLPLNLKDRAVDGIGFVIIGSLVYAIDAAEKGGLWDDKVYMSYFNEHIVGVPLTPVSPDIKKGYPEQSPQDETVKVRAINTKSIQETISLLSQNTWRMPIIAKAHLSSFGDAVTVTSLRKAASFFEEASKRFSQQPLTEPSQRSDLSLVPIDPAPGNAVEQTTINLPEEDQVKAGESAVNLSSGLDDFLAGLSKDL